MIAQNGKFFRLGWGSSIVYSRVNGFWDYLDPGIDSGPVWI